MATTKKRATSTYQDRVVGLIWVDPTRLKHHPDNWRKHPEAQRDAFGGVLAEVGIADAVIAFIHDASARAELVAMTGREARAEWLSGYVGPLMLLDGHLRSEMLAQPIATEEDLRRGWAESDPPNWRVQYHLEGRARQAFEVYWRRVHRRSLSAAA